MRGDDEGGMIAEEESDVSQRLSCLVPSLVWCTMKRNTSRPVCHAKGREVCLNTLASSGLILLISEHLPVTGHHLLY